LAERKRNRGRRDLICLPSEAGQFLLYPPLVSWVPVSPEDMKIKAANRSFQNVAQFRYLGTIVIDQNLVQEEIRR
jgi:hypothetical protein